ncbi:MAG: CDP-alcohol phosphatidyltransferase family protein [Acidobacteriia bacterium]|nr:CDP-alcohol phosphatidyltransferase family protein [Terriglobia bacterium]
MRLLIWIPSLVSLSRLAMTPVVALAILDHRYGAALVWFIAAAFTDIIDGYLARRFGWMTQAGAWLDPLADKAMLVTIYAFLWMAGAIPAWLAGLIFGRDILILVMVGAALALTKLREFPPSQWGKFCTFSQIVTAVTVMVHGGGLLEGLEVVLQVMFVVAGGMTGISGAHYFYGGVRRWMGKD